MCAYDGCYYCFECHENNEYYIPAKILHNWDFQKYPGASNKRVYVSIYFLFTSYMYVLNMRQTFASDIKPKNMYNYTCQQLLTAHV